MGIKSWWGRFTGRSSGTTLPARVSQAEETAAAQLFEELRSLRLQDILPVRKSGKAEWTTWSTDKAVKDGLKASTWVYAAVMKTAIAIASVPLRVERVLPDGTTEPDEDNGLALLLKEPNIAWDWGMLTQIYVSHLLLGGNACITKVRVGGVPAELWPLSPAIVAPIPSTTEHIAGYLVKVTGSKDKTIDSRDLVHMMLPDPSNPRWGMSPLQAAAKAVDVDVESAKWQKVSLQNLMIPPGVFVFDRNINKDQVKAAKDLLKEQYAGSKYAREHLFLGNGAKYIQLGLTPQEVDFLGSREVNAEEIAAAFQIPPPILGLLRKSTYSNMETAERVWWEHTLVGLIRGIVGALNRQLAPEFSTGSGAGSLRIAPDFTDVPALQARFHEQVKTAKELWSMGVPFAHLNQRLRLGLPSFEGDDISYVPTSVQPAGTSQQSEEARARLELLRGGKALS